MCAYLRQNAPERYGRINAQAVPRRRSANHCPLGRQPHFDAMDAKQKKYARYISRAAPTPRSIEVLSLDGGLDLSRNNFRGETARYSDLSSPRTIVQA